MNLRLAAAVLVSGGLIPLVGAQTPPDPASNPAPMNQPATPSSSTPPVAEAPRANPNMDKAIEELRKNNIDGAIDLLRKAYEKDKTLEPPMVTMARIAAANNQGQAARQFLERAGIEDPDHPDPYIVSGQIAMGEGRLMDGMLCFETAIAKASAARWAVEQRQRFMKAARESLAQAYANRNQVKEAIGQLEAILSEDPKNAFIRFQLARLRFLFGADAQALLDLQQAHKDDPDNPQIGLPEINIARFWDSKPLRDRDNKDELAKNKATAQEWFNKALAAYGKDVRAHREFARWLLNESRFEDAEKHLNMAKSLKADDNETNALIGLLHRYRKQYPQAEAIFDDLNRRDRSNAFYAWNLALAMAESENKDKRQQAVTIAQLTQQTRPRDPEAMSILGWCLYKVDRIDDAERAIASAIQTGGGNAPPDTAYYWACVLDKRGKGTEARDMLKKALDAKAPFVYREQANALFNALIQKHGPAKEESKDEKKSEKKP